MVFKLPILSVLAIIECGVEWLYLLMIMKINVFDISSALPILLMQPSFIAVTEVAHWENSNRQ